MEQIQHKQDAILELTTNADQLAAQALQNSSNTMNEVDAFASRMDDFERIANRSAFGQIRSVMNLKLMITAWSGF